MQPTSGRQQASTQEINSWAETETPTHKTYTEHIHRTKLGCLCMRNYMWNRLNLHFTRILMFLFLTQAFVHSTFSHISEAIGEKNTVCVCVCVKNEFPHPAQLGNARVDSKLKHKSITTNITQKLGLGIWRTSNPNIKFRNVTHPINIFLIVFFVCLFVFLN